MNNRQSEMVHFGGKWSVAQIQALIKLRYKDFAADFNQSNYDNDHQVWDRFLKKWNSMQEYEIFNVKHVRNKLRSLYNEYTDLANTYDVTLDIIILRIVKILLIFPLIGTL